MEILLCYYDIAKMLCDKNTFGGMKKMKKNHFGKKELIMRNVLASVVTAVIIAVIATLLYISQNPESPFPEKWERFLLDCHIFALSLCTVPIGCVFVILTMKAVESNTFRMSAHRIGLRIKQRMDLKNSEAFNPCLLVFLYSVLRTNNAVLHLPLGQDASALIPNGFCAIPRAGCVFYRYQLILPDAPELDEKTLCSLVRNFLWAQLTNFGIDGLAAVYNSPSYGKLLTIFLDRVWYDETNHLLNMEALYICAEDAAQYAVKAYQRDKEQPRTEPEVYDDQI